MKKLLALLSTIAILLTSLLLFSVPVSAQASIKTQAEAVAWLNSQDGVAYDLDGKEGTQCPEFVKAYVNWLLCGDAWTDCWKRPTGNGCDIWKNTLWQELGWTVYPNTDTFIPQPGDIFSSGSTEKGNHTGVVISSTISSATIADANTDFNGGPVKVENVQWKSSTSYTPYGVTHFIRPIFANSTPTEPQPTESQPTTQPTEPVVVDFTYTISNGEVAITKYIGTAAKVTIPAKIEGYPVTRIGTYAFYEYRKLTGVTIPNSVTSIGSYAFYHCLELTNITIPGGVTSIGGCAFCLCEKLTSVTIPDSVTSIGDWAFRDCEKLTSVAIGNSVTSIGDLAFCGCTGLTSITIPDGVTSIGNAAFEDCSGLASITVGKDNPTYYSEGNCLIERTSKTLLYGCNTSVIPSGVTSIGKGAFWNRTGLASVTIPDSVTSIGEKAFRHCAGLTDITIPNSVTRIGEYAFEYCSGLTSATIGNSVTSIDEKAFHRCTKLTSITVDKSNSTYYSEGNCIIKKSNKTVICGCKTSVIPSGVKSIGSYAFYACAGLTSVTIPDGVTSIEGCAFYICEDLAKITIPHSVTRIGQNAFNGCTKLANIYYDGTQEDWKKISLYTGNTPLKNATIHFTEPAPTTTGISLTIGSDIHINFYMDLTEDAAKNGKMTFKIGNRTVKGTVEKGENGYCFSPPINALEMAEKVTATFTYNGVEYKQEYSVAEYIDVILNGKDDNGKPYPEKAKALVRKIANYGHYVQQYLQSIHNNVTIGDGGYVEMPNFEDFDIDVNAAKTKLVNNFKKPAATKNLAFDSRSVYFDSATALNYYVTVKNNKLPTAVCAEGKPVTVEKYSDNLYIVSVQDILATEIGTPFTVTVNGEFVLTGSVLDYCGAMMKAHNVENPTAKDTLAVNAMAAFYEYHKASAEYDAYLKSLGA